MNDPEDAMPQILGIGLANLSPGSHGPFTFFWLLDSPGVQSPEGSSQGPVRPIRFMKKMVLIILLMLHR